MSDASREATQQAIDALEGLGEWTVRHCSGWNNEAYKNAVDAIAALKVYQADMAQIVQQVFRLSTENAQLKAAQAQAEPIAAPWKYDATVDKFVPDFTPPAAVPVNQQLLEALKSCEQCLTFIHGGEPLRTDISLQLARASIAAAQSQEQK